MRTKRCSFGLPKGRSNYVIYAVVLREHPTIVKLGRTTNWRNRSREYHDWNFATGDGVLASAVYCITEEYVDLAAVEAACLGAMGQLPHRGKEWFKATLQQAKDAIESVLCNAQLSFDEL